MMILSWELIIYFFIGTTILSMVRIVRGPSVVDRLIGLNMVSAQTLVILVLLAANENLSVYLDVAMVYAIFGFVGLLSITRYLERKEEKP